MNSQLLYDKCDLLAANYHVVKKSAKLDNTLVQGLGAMMFTQYDCEAVESEIRDCRAIMKSKTGFFSNFNGYTRLALLCKMSLAENAEAYLDAVMSVYENLKQAHVFHSESEVLASSSIVDMVDPAYYQDAIDATLQVFEIMRDQHPLLTTRRDMSLAALLGVSGLDVNPLLDDAEECYQIIRKQSLVLTGEAVQSISAILALHPGSPAEKCERFMQLRNGLKAAGSRLNSEHAPLIAAFVGTSMSADEIIAEVHEADVYLKDKPGFGAFGLGAQMRRTMAGAMVLKAHEEEIGANGTSSMVDAITTATVQEVIQQIVTTIIITSAVIASNNASHAS